MKTMKKLLTILLAIATAAMLAIPAFATVNTTEATITKDQTGSITVHKYKSASITGGTATGTTADKPTGLDTLDGVEFTLYQVVSANDVIKYYNGTTDKLTINGAEYAEITVDTFVTGNALKTGITAIASWTKTTANGGIAKFENLPVGMYVLIETDSPAEVTNFSAPSLISVPMVNTANTTNGVTTNTKWLYDINVYPKNSTSQGEVTLTKVGADGTTALQGVKFTLEKQDGQNWTTVNADLVTNASGQISTGSLPHGTYRLTETETLAGYILDAVPIVFTVTTDNKVTCTDARATIDLGGTSGTAALSIKLKNEKPDLTKTVKNNGGQKETTSDTWVHDTQYSIGDEIEYQITVDVPSNITQLSTFTVTDTPEHLIDKTPTSITYGSGISVPTDAYAVTLNTPTNGFTVAFVPSKLGDVAGKTITISYKAVLQANAAIYGAGNPNTAKLDYTNKIKTDGTPDTTTDHIEDKAVVYTYATKIIKHKDTASGEVMGGIEFQLLPSKEGTAMDVVKVEDGIYRLPVGSETTVKTLVTKSDGSIVIRGLENGTYYLKEIKTISGYNLLSEPIALTVSVTESTSWTTSSDYVNGTLTKRTYSSSTVKFNDLDSVNESTYTTNVINKKGFTLPQTGGLGTLTLSVIGCALVLGGALVLVNSKKRAK